MTVSSLFVGPHAVSATPGSAKSGITDKYTSDGNSTTTDVTMVNTVREGFALAVVSGGNVG